MIRGGLPGLKVRFHQGVEMKGKKKYHGAGVKGVSQEAMQKDVGYGAKGGRFGKYPDTMEEIDAFGRRACDKLEKQSRRGK